MEAEGFVGEGAILADATLDGSDSGHEAGEVMP
jgi:hypothetical protein